MRTRSREPQWPTMAHAGPTMAHAGPTMACQRPLHKGPRLPAPLLPATARHRLFTSTENNAETQLYNYFSPAQLRLRL